MAIDFNAIREAVRDLLTKELPSQVRVAVEATDIGASSNPEVGIYIPGIKWEEVEIGASDPYETTIAVNLFLSATHPDGAQQAVERRDVLFNQVVDALKSDRRLGGAVLNTSLSAGDLDTAKNDVGYIAAANVTINARIMA
jgi:hypothetical protein